MPIEFDDQGLGIFGLGTRGLRWYDDVGDLRAELYLDQNGQLNLSGLVISAGQAAAGGGSSGGGSVVSGAPVSASYLTLAADGSLSSERIFTPGSGLSAVDGGAGGAYTLSVDGTVVRTTRQVATDATLTGGGDLSANRTLGLNLSNANTWAALQTFGAGVAISGANALTLGGDVSLSRTGANVLGLATGDALRSSNYSSGVSGWGINADGSAEFENVQIRGELRTTVLKFQEMQATAGTLIVSKSAGVLAADATTAASIGASFTLNVKDSDAGAALFAVNDVLWIKTWTGAAIVSIYCTVTAVGSPSGGARNYTVTLNSGSTSTTVRAGTAVADYGPANTGAITLSADGAVGSSANISIVRHAGSPWSAQTLLARLGNLNGSYGLATDAHGIGLGDYAAGNYLFYDNSRGFQFRAGAGSVGIDASGIRLTKGSGSAVGALKFYDSVAFASQVGGLSVDRGSYADALLFTDATGFDQYARTYLAAIGDTALSNSRREGYLEVNVGAGSRWGTYVYQGGSAGLGGGGLSVSPNVTQVGDVPAGNIYATGQMRQVSWSAGVATLGAGFDASGNAYAGFVRGTTGRFEGSVDPGAIVDNAPGVEIGHTGSIGFIQLAKRGSGGFAYDTSVLKLIAGAIDTNISPIYSYDGTTATAAAAGGVVLAMQPADGQVWMFWAHGSGGDMNWRATGVIWNRFGTLALTTISNTAVCVPSVSGNSLNITNNDATLTQAFKVRAIRIS